MAQRKKRRSQETETPVFGRREAEQKGFLKQFRFGESYTSLILGIVVVVVAALALVFVARLGQKAQAPTQDTSSTSTSSVSDQEITKPLETDEAITTSQKTYNVVAGDTLWSIAEKQYKSGFGWEFIAKENKIGSPYIITPGTKLAIPTIQNMDPSQDEVKAPTLTTTQPEVGSTSSAITGVSYTVHKGDNLWNIAVRAYGDGYRWVDIAKANNLANPQVIHSGNVFKIPR